MNRGLVMKIIIIVAIVAAVAIGINMVRGKAATVPATPAD